MVFKLKNGSKKELILKDLTGLEATLYFLRKCDTELDFSETPVRFSMEETDREFLDRAGEEDLVTLFSEFTKKVESFSQ